MIRKVKIMSDKPDYDKIVAEFINTAAGKIKLSQAMRDALFNPRPKLLCTVCFAEYVNLQDHCKLMDDKDHIIYLVHNS